MGIVCLLFIVQGVYKAIIFEWHCCYNRTIFIFGVQGYSLFENNRWLPITLNPEPIYLFEMCI